MGREAEKRQGKVHTLSDKNASQKTTHKQKLLSVGRLFEEQPEGPGEDVAYTAAALPPSSRCSPIRKTPNNILVHVFKLLLLGTS
jgi:hypothetical protein